MQALVQVPTYQEIYQRLQEARDNYSNSAERLSSVQNSRNSNQYKRLKNLSHLAEIFMDDVQKNKPEIKLGPREKPIVPIYKSLEQIASEIGVKNATATTYIHGIGTRTNVVYQLAK